MQVIVVISMTAVSSKGHIILILSIKLNTKIIAIINYRNKPILPKLSINNYKGY